LPFGQEQSALEGRVAKPKPIARRTILLMMGRLSIRRIWYERYNVSAAHVRILARNGVIERTDIVAHFAWHPKFQSQTTVRLQSGRPEIFPASRTSSEVIRVLQHVSGIDIQSQPLVDGVDPPGLHRHVLHQRIHKVLI
jgi:hypothetical protein